MDNRIRSLQGLLPAATEATPFHPPADTQEGFQQSGDPYSDYMAHFPTTNPFFGSGWDRWLDSIGASQPGGARLGATKGNPLADAGASVATTGVPQSLKTLQNLDMTGQDKAAMHTQPWKKF